MLEFQEIKLRRGAEVLIDRASFTIFGGEKVGVVGRNGCGKSTLLALVRGELACDSGEFVRSQKLTVVSVLQELPRTEAEVVDYILDGDAALRRIERDITAAQASGNGEREALLHAELESLGGYGARARAAETAVGLGFAHEDLAKPVSALSGGLQMRANLARALLGRADVLLLDEPTNHLDLDAVLWLENWLRRFAGTLLLVSHDREFLDAVVSRVIHIENAVARVYEGNYSSYERQAAAERLRITALAERQAREAARIRSFVDRFKAKASKARQAQSRLKWLAKLEEIAPPSEAAEFEWEFESAAKLPQPLLVLDDVAVGYGERTVISRVRLDVNPGDRLGVLGRNGAGKSTLMRTIAGQVPTRAGTRLPAAELNVGFFAQLELDRFADDDNAMQALTRRLQASGSALLNTEQQRRDHLGRFGFRGERVFEPVEHFSGGERARLALALLVAERPNLLLLDEPTNHLDFEMRHALAMALQDFAGAVVVVSHDRSLLRAVCEQFVVVNAGAVTPFDGDLDDYASWLDDLGSSNSPAAGTAAGLSTTSTATDRREQRRLEAEARQRVAPIKQGIRALEQQLDKLNAEHAELERQLADPVLYADAAGNARARELLARRNACAQAIHEAEEAWLTRSEELERAIAAG
jgi:ATP-binding cassette, subfamily F, member 3